MSKLKQINQFNYLLFDYWALMVALFSFDFKANSKI